MTKCDICDKSDDVTIETHSHTVCDTCKTRYQHEIEKLLEKAHILEKKGQEIIDLSKCVANDEQVDKLLEDVLQMELLEAAYLLMFVLKNSGFGNNYRSLMSKIAQERFRDKMKVLIPYEGNNLSLIYIVRQSYDIRREQQKNN